jgi:hypothetical protein
VQVGGQHCAERGGDGEEQVGGHRDADQRQVGLAFGDEEVGILDPQQGDADEGEVGQKAEPGDARGGD